MAKKYNWSAALTEGDSPNLGPEGPKQGAVDWYAPVREQVDFESQFEPEPAPEEPETTAGDYGVAMMQGFAAIPEQIGGAVEYLGQATGIEPVRKLGTAARRGASEAQEWWQKQYSEGAKEIQQKEWATWDEAAAWRDPRAIALGATQAAPSLLVSVIPGAALAKLGASAKSIATVSGSVTGTQVGGSTQSSIASEIEGYTDEQMMMIPGVKEGLDAGGNLEDIRLYLIEEATRYATPTAAAIGFGSGVVGGPIEAALVTRTGTQGAKGLAGRVATGAGVEATQESIESGIAETMVPNIAMGRPTLEGVGEAAVQGAVLGAGVGGPLGFAPSGQVQQPDVEPDVEPTVTPTPEPEVTAAPTVGVPDIAPDAPPEPVTYVNRQLELLDKGTRKAVLVGPGTELGEIDSDKYEVAEVAADTQIVVNRGDDTTIAQVREAYATGDDGTIQATLGEVLGYQTVGESPTGEVLTVRNADREVVYDSVFDGTDAALAQANAAVSALGEGASVEVRSVQDAIFDREIQAYNETQPAVEMPETAAQPTAAPVEPEVTAPPAPAPADIAAPPATEATQQEQPRPSDVQPPQPQPAAEPSPPQSAVREEAPAAPTVPSPYSLSPVPDDENPSMQTVADSYTNTVNQAANIPRGEQIGRKAELADDLISTLVAYKKDLEAEGYRVSGLNKIVRPVLGAVTVTNLMAGNYTSVAERARKKIGVSLTPEMEAVVSEKDLGEGRKSGQWSGKVTNKKFDKFLQNVKEFIDKANEQRQAKRAAPATTRAAEAKRVSRDKETQQQLIKPKKEAVPEKVQEPTVQKQETVEPAPKEKVKPEPARKAKPLKSIMIEVDAIVQETGAVESVPMNAEEALNYENERIGRLKQLVGCLLA